MRRFLLYCVMCLLAHSLSAQSVLEGKERLTPLFSEQKPPLLINEIMQGNVDGVVVDNDFTDSWLELYNPSDEELDLNGYYISEKNDIHTAHKFSEEVKIAPHSHQLIYCDKQSEGLHVPFRLDTDKGKLYLWKPDFTLADSLHYPAMPAPNIAYGRTTDGDSIWAHECLPTPTLPNSGQTSETLLPEPLFSLESQLIDPSGMLTITLPVDAPANAEIYWTTNGSEPTESSPHAQSVDIALTQSTVIRAKLMASDCLSRPSSVRSYIVPVLSHEVPVLSLVTDSAYLYSSDFGILAGSDSDPQANFMQRWRRPVYVESIGNTEWDIHQLCQTAVGGATSRVHSQKSLKLYAKKHLGKKTFKGEPWSDKPEVTKVKSLMLRNGGSRCMGSRINDAFVQTLFGQHVADLDWQAYEPVVLYINGQYQGIYELRERSDEDNVAANHGYDDDDIWQNTNIYKGPGNYNDLVEKAWSSQTTYEQMEQLLDIDELINYLTAEAYAGNTDWPRNNIFAWRPREEGGRWRWLLKDLDQFRFYPDTCNFLNYIFCQGREGEQLRARYYDGAHRIFSKLHEFEPFRQRFVNHLAVYLGDFLRPDVALPLFRAQRQQIEPELPLTFSTFGVPSTINWARQELNYIDKYIQRRPDQLYRDLTDLYQLGELVPLTIDGIYLSDSLQAADTCDILINEVSLTTHRLEGYWFTDYPIHLDAQSDVHAWRLTVTYPDSTQQVIDFVSDTLTLNPADYTEASSLHFSLYPSDHSAIEVVRPDVLPDKRRLYDLWGRRLASPRGFVIQSR